MDCKCGGGGVVGGGDGVCVVERFHDEVLCMRFSVLSSAIANRWRPEVE